MCVLNGFRNVIDFFLLSYALRIVSKVNICDWNAIGSFKTLPETVNFFFWQNAIFIMKNFHNSILKIHFKYEKYILEYITCQIDNKLGTKRNGNANRIGFRDPLICSQIIARKHFLIKTASKGTLLPPPRHNGGTPCIYM